MKVETLSDSAQVRP